jgi:hypothetical protein
MMYFIIPIVLGTVLLVAIGYTFATRNRASTIERQLTKAQIAMVVRDLRMMEFRAAYKMAKEELGSEPTVDQIFLTRDTMRGDK